MPSGPAKDLLELALEIKRDTQPTPPPAPADASAPPACADLAAHPPTA